MTFSVSPLATVLEPPEKAPAEYSVPPVLSRVAEAPVPNTRKQPPTVPEPVMAKDAAAEVVFEPLEADDQETV